MWPGKTAALRAAVVLTISSTAPPPMGPIGGGAVDDIVSTTAALKAAVLPGHIHCAGPVDPRGGQYLCVQVPCYCMSRSYCYGDARIPARAAVGRRESRD